MRPDRTSGAIARRDAWRNGPNVVRRGFHAFRPEAAWVPRPAARRGDVLRPGACRECRLGLDLLTRADDGLGVRCAGPDPPAGTLRGALGGPLHQVLLGPRPAP